MDQESLDRQSLQFDPVSDELIAARDLRHGDGFIRAGEVIPIAEFDDERLRQFVRVRFAKVIFGGKGKVVAQVRPEPVPAAPAVPAAARKTGESFACDHAGCTKGPFSTKLALGAHRRSHRG